MTDDRELARNMMRPGLALYVGGMGSRKQNFYNNLVQRYGFEDAAQAVQDLYLDGKKEEAAAALPDELIDMVSLCGPRDVVRDRLAAFRDAGVGTLMVMPMASRGRTGSSSCAPWPSSRVEPRRTAAGLPRRLRPARPRLSHAGAGRGARRARPRGHLRDLVAGGARRWRRAGMRFRAAPEYPTFPTREQPLGPYEAVVRATAETRPAVAGRGPDVVVHDILTLAPALAAELEGRPGGDADPARVSGDGGRVPALRVRRPAAAHARGPDAVAGVRAAGAAGVSSAGASELNDTRGGSVWRRSAACTAASAGS